MTAKTISDKLGVVLCGPGWRPGLSRLGDPSELPGIVRPVNTYDPQISWLKNAYIIVHFAIILMFYHELTLFQHQFNASVVNVALFSLIASITSLGIILDNKRRYRNLLELVRCLLFFQARKSIIPIIDGGLERSGVSFKLRAVIVSLLFITFALSVVFNLLELLLNNAHLLLQFARQEIKKKIKIPADRCQSSEKRKSEKIRVM